MVNLKIVGVLGMLCFTGWLSAHNVKMEKEVIVGDGIAKFVPKGFNLSQMPSFALKAERASGKRYVTFKLAALSYSGKEKRTC